MPVGVSVFPEMMSNSSAKTAGTEGTPDISVIPLIEFIGPQFADFNGLILVHLEDQNIGSRNLTDHIVNPPSALP